ncbi:MAG: glycosyltransferase family 4 protein [Phycisphaerae bacterium]|nr:glycosyltransferase family 4 protein [Phycisphaerae bacterium]
MRIAVDARTVFTAHRRGTGKNLVDLYRHMAVLRPAWRILMFHQYEAGGNPFADLPNVETRRIDIRGDRLNLWQQVRLPLAAWRAGASVLHCPANTAPRFPLVPMVLTLHDLLPFDPELATKQDARWSGNIAAAARRAARIIVPSRFTCGQIVKKLGVSTDNITVNPWAADSGCRRVTDPGELGRVRAKYGLADERRYVLALGSSDKRKNTVGILEAWAVVPDRLRSQISLLAVGIPDPALDGFARRARELDVASSVVLGGFADETDLSALISGAEVLCYPSLGEGFGLPVLDGFACETAVLTSSVSSLPEVAGDAAWLVDPADRRAIAAGLVRLLDDQRLRNELVQRGRVRASEFTWRACAETACRVFEQAARERT